MADEKLLTRKQAVAYLQARNCAASSYSSLSNKAANNNRGGGPPHVKDGSRVLYRPSELDDWINRRRRRVE